MRSARSWGFSCNGGGREGGVEGRGGADAEAFGLAGDEKGGDVALHGVIMSGLRAERHEQGGKAIGLLRAFGGDGDGGEPVAHGGEAARVEDVVLPLAADFAPVAVVARGGEGLIAQGDDFLRLHGVFQRRFDGDAPGLAAGLEAAGAHFAGDFNEVAGRAQPDEPGADAIDGVAGGGAVEFDADGGVFAELAALHAQVLHAHALAQSGQFVGSGRLRGRGLLVAAVAKSPGFKGGQEGDVECAFAVLVQRQGVAGQGEGGFGHVHAGARRRGVKARQGGVGAVGGDGLVDFVKDGLHAALHFERLAGGGAGHVADVEGAAHRGAGQFDDGGRGGLAGGE